MDYSNVASWNDCTKSVPGLGEMAHLGEWNKRAKKWKWQTVGYLDDNLFWRFQDHKLIPNEPTHWLPY